MSKRVGEGAETRSTATSGAERLCFKPFRGAVESKTEYAGVAELADAPDLGSGGFHRGGSSPFARTKNTLSPSGGGGFFLNRMEGLEAKRNE